MFRTLAENFRTSRRKSRRSARRVIARRLRVEGLEHRQMLAAGLTASLTNGILTVTGTEAAERIDVQEVDGRFQVEGLLDTYPADTVKRIVIDGKGGNDTIVPLVSLPTTIYGGSGNDTIYGGFGDDLILGQDGNDTINANGGNDRLVGGAGDDSLTGSYGNDTFQFDADVPQGSDRLVELRDGGTDLLSFSGTTSQSITVDLSASQWQTVNANLRLLLASSTATWTPTFERVVGGAMSDRLTGNALDNVLWGGAGNDVLTGGAGNDVLAGGAGDDSYAFDADSPLGNDRLIEARDGGGDLLDFSGTTTQSILVNLSAAAWQAVNANLRLRLSSDTAAWAPTLEHITGGALGDRLVGNVLNNGFSGGAGNDLLIGGAGNDTLLGGAGNDVYAFDADGPLGSDEVLEEPEGGSDLLDFSSTTTQTVTVDLSASQWQDVNSNLRLLLLSRAGVPWDPTFERIFGGAKDDSLTGNTLANVLRGGPGDDTLAGGRGNDCYSFDADGPLGDDQLVEASNGGNDLLDFSATTTLPVTLNLSEDQWQQVNGNLRIQLSSTTTPWATQFEGASGGAGDDVLTGNSLNNVLCGGAGNDTLTGGPGNDVFYGGVGSDTMVIEFNGGDRTPDLEAADQVLFDDSRDPTLAREAPDAKVAWQSAALSVLGADDGGEANLTYSWTVTSLPEGAPAPVFSVNGSNAAKDTVVTFGRAGTYSLSVTIADRGGRQVTDSAEIVVEQMAASMTVTPYHQYVNHRSSAQLYAQVFDQFGNALAAQPSLTWQATAGSINSNGLFTAPSNACTVTIIASTGSVYQTAYVTVTVPTIFVGVPFREYYDWLPRLVEGDDDWDEGFDCTVGAQITWDSSQVRANLYMRGREREPDWTTVDGWSGSFQVYAAPAGWRVKSISRSGSDFRSCYFEENRSWQEFSGGNVVQKYKVYGFGFGGNPHTAGSWSQVWVYFNPITVVLEEI